MNLYSRTEICSWPTGMNPGEYAIIYAEKGLLGNLFAFLRPANRIELAPALDTYEPIGPSYDEVTLAKQEILRLERRGKSPEKLS